MNDNEVTLNLNSGEGVDVFIFIEADFIQYLLMFRCRFADCASNRYGVKGHKDTKLQSGARVTF
jgi:hypothetical protein